MFTKSLPLLLVLVLPLACDKLFTTHFLKIGLTGLPRCAPGAMLYRPIMVELTSGDHRIRRYYTGTGLTESISIPEGKRDWEARFGLCREQTDPAKSQYRCDSVEWYAKKRVSLDPGQPATTLSVAPPPESGCWSLPPGGP